MEANRLKHKVLQISYGALVKAGIQLVVMNIARGIKDDFDVDVLLTSNRPGYYDEEFLGYGNIYRINCDVRGLSTLRRYAHYCARPFKQFFYTYRLIRKNGYDIVHLHGGQDAGPMFLAAKLAGVKHIIAHSHNTASPEKRTLPSRIYRGMNQWLLNRCATVKMGVSKAANSYLYGDSPCVLLNNPVEIDRFVNAEPAFQKEALTLVNVGRYGYQKNQSFILELLKLLLEKGYDARLKLVGFGADEEMLKKKISQMGIEEAVQMIPGNGDADIPGILAASDIFVFPSRFEGLGIVALEAQAAGCLCLASDVVPEETNVGMCAYLPLSAGANVWVQKILDMVQNQEEYVLDAVALNRFRAESIQKEICEFYHSLLCEENVRK